MLFGMLVSKDALNNKSFKTIDGANFKCLLLLLFTFIDLAWYGRTVIVHNNA